MWNANRFDEDVSAESASNPERVNIKENYFRLGIVKKDETDTEGLWSLLTLKL